MARISKEVKMERALKFGVEIEFCNDVRSELARALETKGVAVKLIGGPNHATSRSWKIETDSSCGYEIVSPVLKGDKGLEELQKVCEALTEVGAKVNKNCGLHVHHDANDMELESIKNVYRIYSKHQEVIDSMMPESRRDDNNRYCKSISSFKMDKIEKINTLGDFEYEIGGKGEGHYTTKRYYKVNFASYLCYGTIEFRQHSATVDFEKIKNWVLITNLIMQRATGKKVRPKGAKRLASSDDIDKAYDFYMELGISGTELSNYVRTRKAKLNKSAEQVA